MKIVFLLATFVIVVVASPDFDISKDDDEEWEMFKIQFDRHYGSREEEQMRKALFLKTLAMVRKINHDYATGRGTWTAGINDMADWTIAETRHLTGLRTGPPRNFGFDSWGYNWRR